MKQIEVKVKAPKVSREMTVSYNLGETLAELSEQFGEQIVYDMAVGRFEVLYQNVVRVRLEKGLTENQILDEIKNWKPGVALRGSDSMTVVLERAKKMTPEQLAEYIGQLQSMITAGEAE